MTATTSAATPRATGERFGARNWITLVILGLTGQLAWTVENMYLNVFVYDTITDDPAVIAWMVAASAAAATIATILVGAWSDRLGRRRVFVAVGYVLWGASTIAFGLVSPERAGELLPWWSATAAAVAAIIALDCVMSFIGSGANDAAFNAWITDSTVAGNRGRVDSVFAILPLIAMLVVFGALDGFTRAGQWGVFFAVVGGAVIVVGLLSLVLMRDAPSTAPAEGSVLAGILEGFRPSSVRAAPLLYLALCVWAVIGTASQVFLPFLIIYLQRTLRIEGYALVLGVVLLAASAASVLGGRVIDRIGKTRAILPAVALFVVGLLAMAAVRDMAGVMVAGTVMMAGFMLSVASIAATTRDLTPSHRAGSVQGLRMVFAILVPMVVGPAIGAAVISGAGETYEDLGVVKQVPTAWIFPAAAVVLLVAVPLVVVLARRFAARPVETDHVEHA